MSPRGTLIPSIQQILSHRPVLISPAGKTQAAVALVLKDVENDPCMFFIERAKNENDPWSGQIAFPGGNREEGDHDIEHTAIRETYEEVGLTLLPSNRLGRLDDQQGRNNYRELPLIISCFIFQSGTETKTVNNYEVGNSFWVEIAHLQNPENRLSYQTEYSPDPYPAIRLPGGQVLWGLTFRFVEMFLDIVNPSNSHLEK